MDLHERLLELGVGVEQIVDLAEIAAFDEGAQPLRIRHDEIVLLLARGQRRVHAGIEVGPRDEVDLELHGVAGLRLVLLVEELLHDAGRRPIRHRHRQRHVLSVGGHRAARHQRCGEAYRRHYALDLCYRGHL